MSIPYSKLRDNPKFGPIKGTIPPRTVIVIDRSEAKRQEWKSLIFFVIMLSVIGLILFSTAFFAKAKYGFDSADKEMDKFLHIFDPPNAPQEDEILLPLPKRFPMTIEPSRCNLDQSCGNQKDIFTETQEKIDYEFGKWLLNHHDYNGMLQKQMNTCLIDYQSPYRDLSLPFERCFERKMHQVKEKIADVNNAGPISSALKVHFGIDHLIKATVEPNYIAPSGNLKYIIYIDQAIPEAPVRYVAPRNSMPSVSKLIRLNLPRIRSYKSDSEDSSKWKSFTIEEADQRWTFLSFQDYFEGLGVDTKDLVFVVKTPEYLDKLSKLFELVQTRQDNDALHIALASYTLNFECEKYLGQGRIERELEEKYGIGVGHTDDTETEAIRFCGNSMRETLGKYSSAIFDDLFRNSKKKIDMIDTMVEKILRQMKNIVHKSTNSEATKSRMIQKLNSLEWDFSSTNTEDLGRLLNGFRHDQDSHFVEFIEKIKGLRFNETLKQLKMQRIPKPSSTFQPIDSSDLSHLKYSRTGNWMNIPSASQILPIFTKFGVPNADFYAQLGWKIASEMAKAIDNAGLRFDDWGVYKIEDEYEDINAWEDLTSVLPKRSNEETRTTTNEIIGLKVAFDVYQQELSRLKTLTNFDDMTKMASRQFLSSAMRNPCGLRPKESRKFTLMTFINALNRRAEKCPDTSEFVHVGIGF
ncbi:unnamed protein product [Bursaphelenchus xylophilus]|uniref:(pine wood nematode) hypothetical protein n=1 Tax=Bursaphelenchus xylophilus TaxID=6326 RepID=A0A1I7SSD7_BURXY|nr:unnamed protein product [Bursaphelenchus xylophilus]CAG9097683.1 unnamed protein product [Bursaphelenchus xylophilus]